MPLNKSQTNPNNIDFLVQNSTKKIVDLIRRLPDGQSLEAAFQAETSQLELSSEQDIAKSKRFESHPNQCNIDDAFESDGDTSASSIRDEVVDLEAPKHGTGTARKHYPHSDSGDEFCDITVRTDVPDLSLSLEERLGAYHLVRDCGSPLSGAKSRINNKGDLLQMKSCDEYEKLLADISAKVKKSSKTKSKRCAFKSETQILSDADPQPKSPSKSESARVSEAPSFSSVIMESQSQMFQDCNSCSITDGTELISTDDQKRFKGKDLNVSMSLKLKSLIEKCISVLFDCRSIFECGVELPDGREDYLRRKKRTIAFASRFSRHYLYQLSRSRIVIENSINPFTKAYRTTNSYILTQRFHNAYQTIFQALEAYKKHLPTGIVRGMPLKFRELLDLTIKFSELFKALEIPASEEKTEIDIINDCCHSMLTDQALVCTRRVSSANLSLTSKRREAAATSVSSAQTQTQMRLAMYSSQEYNSKNMSAQAKQRYQVPSKYRTATFKHRPPPQLQLPVQIEKLPSKPRKSKPAPENGKEKGKPTDKLGVIDIDNDICTYIQDTANDEDFAYGNGKTDCQNLKIFAQEFFNKVTKGAQAMSSEEYSCILDHFVEILGEPKISSKKFKEERIQELLERKFDRQIDDMKFDEFVNNIIYYANLQYQNGSQNNLIRRGATTVSITGPENAKLICMKEAQSESSLDIMSQIQSIDPEGNLLRKLSKLSVSQQTDSNELIYKERGEDEDGVKLVNLDKIPIRQSHFREKILGNQFSLLPALPKDVMLRIIEYKLQFHKESKQNLIYKKNTELSNWIVASQIADTLMEEALLSVARDIQVDKILKKIYAQEFK